MPVISCHDKNYNAAIEVMSELAIKCLFQFLITHIKNNALSGIMFNDNDIVPR